MKTINYKDAEKRLFELNNIVNIKEDVYLTAFEFVLKENNKFIKNINFNIYILFVNEIQFDFDHNDTDKYCKIEIRSKDKKVTLTAFFYENRDGYPVIEDIEFNDIFLKVKDFFK